MQLPLFKGTNHADKPCAKPGARALYLGTRDKKHVTCTAEALVVRNEQRQIRRYPLARVSRVVSSTVTDWSGGALALCLKSGIGITWMDAAGHPLGTCYPAQRQYSPFVTAIELLTENADGLTRYQHWLRSRRMDILIRWSKTQAEPIDPAAWESTKREWVYGQHIAAHLPAALRGHCLAWVGAQLAAQGLHPELWGAARRAHSSGPGPGRSAVVRNEPGHRQPGVAYMDVPQRASIGSMKGVVA